MSERQIVRVYEERTIRDKVAGLGEALAQEEETPLIVSLVGGSVIFLADLVRALARPLRYGFIQVQYSDGADGLMEIHYPISLDVSAQRLLILKDVVSTGVIETYLSEQFRERGATEVRFAALIDLPEQRKTDFDADFRLFTPKKSGSFVGYGLKYRGLYGNLAYIGRLADD